MTFLEKVRISISRAKHGDEMLEKHPFLFPFLVGICLLFFAPLLLWQSLKKFFGE